MHRALVCCCALGLIVVMGCGPSGPPRKETFKVKGKLTVDGAPPELAVQIECHDVKGFDADMPTFSRCDSQEGGVFEIATYQKGDGVPVGEYVLTFTSREFNLMSRDYTGPDKLKNRYKDPEKSEIKFSIVDKSVDLGEIKLTTK
jgi:hypothetical protein